MAQTDPIMASRNSNDLLPAEARRFEIAQSQPSEMTIEQIVDQKRKIQELMQAVMIDGEHYGVIPGTGTKEKPGKKTLLKSGAELIGFMFKLRASFEVMDKVDTPERVAYTLRVRLTHIPTGDLISEGVGHCNSREAKYLRLKPRICPKCGKATIFKSKNEGEGWYCWRKKDGCGATFPPFDIEIEGQSTEPDDPSDLHNTIIKMAFKRAYVHATLNGTAASDFFTQDLEDLPAAAAASPVSSGTAATVEAGPERVKPATVTSEPKFPPAPADVKTKIWEQFAEKHGASVADLERYLVCPSSDWDTQDVLTLKALWAELRDGKRTPQDAFAEKPPGPAPKSRTDALADKVAGKKAAPRTVNAEQDPSQAPVDYDTVPF